MVLSAIVKPPTFTVKNKKVISSTKTSMYAIVSQQKPENFD